MCRPIAMAISAIDLICFFFSFSYEKYFTSNLIFASINYDTYRASNPLTSLNDNKFLSSFTLSAIERMTLDERSAVLLNFIQLSNVRRDAIHLSTKVTVVIAVFLVAEELLMALIGITFRFFKFFLCLFLYKKSRFRCCKMHDYCYEKTSCPKYLEYFVPYLWKCYKGHPICGELLFVK